MYGRGMGACVALRLRDADAGALRLLGDWVALRLGLLVRAVVRLDGRSAREETVMLGSTLAGLAHGLRVRATPRGPAVEGGA
jgi:hypothetical protein